VGTLTARVLPPALMGGRRSRFLVERNIRVSRRIWLILASGFFEPVLFLLAIGVGVGGLVGSIDLGNGRTVPYDQFVAPAMLAASAMNGAVYESTGNVFFKLKYARTYEGVLATPLSPGDVALAEIAWALLRGGAYSTAFTIVMAALGLIVSPWGVLLPFAALLIGFAFAATGMVATTFMRSWSDFDLIQLAVLPLFLFSATFVPLDAYPRGVQWAVEVTPLYQGVALLRGLSLGHVGPALAGHAAYLAAMGVVGLAIAARRVARLLQP
jgi:lipooligosaccharide transport system permease protein